MNRIIVVLGAALLSLGSIALGQQDSSWGKWNWLVGNWVGEGSGMPGQSTGWFSFHRDLDANILVRKSHSEFPASGNKPGVIHDDLMIVYAHPTGQPGKAIYFDNEGHVIDYSITYADRSITLTSVVMKNAPVFRLTYTMLEQDEAGVKFEMSQDGQKFHTYLDGKSRKVK